MTDDESGQRAGTPWARLFALILMIIVFVAIVLIITSKFHLRNPYEATGLAVLSVAAAIEAVTFVFDGPRYYGSALIGLARKLLTPGPEIGHGTVDAR